MAKPILILDTNTINDFYGRESTPPWGRNFNQQAGEDILNDLAKKYDLRITRTVLEETGKGDPKMMAIRDWFANNPQKFHMYETAGFAGKNAGEYSIVALFDKDSKFYDPTLPRDPAQVTIGSGDRFFTKQSSAWKPYNKLSQTLLEEGLADGTIPRAHYEAVEKISGDVMRMGAGFIPADDVLAGQRTAGAAASKLADAGRITASTSHEVVEEMLKSIEEFKKKAEFTTTLADGTKVHVVKSPMADGNMLEMRLPLPDFQQAPLELEQQFGLKGVAGHYKLPKGLSAIDLQTYAMTQMHLEMRGEITKEVMEQNLTRVRTMLEKLNPQLKALETLPNSATGAYDVILGVASEFNPKDIQSFLDGKNGAMAARDTEWASLNNKLSTKMRMDWVPSMETMENMERQVTRPGFKLPEGAGFIRQGAANALSKVAPELVPAADKLLFVGGKALPVLAGAYITYNAVSERVNGNNYTKLLEANGLGPNSAPMDAYHNYQEKDIVEGVALTIPAGVTQVAWALSSLMRYAAGDVDHRKLISNIVARGNSGASEEKLRESVRAYVDSALPTFHWLSSEKQQNILDNIMEMKNSGKMKDWSQLPGLIGLPGNIAELQDSKKYFNPELVKLPDPAKTTEALYGKDKDDPGLAAEIIEARTIERMRQQAQVPDIDWEQARERMKEGGKDALMTFLSGQMPAVMWENTKGIFSHALDVFNLDKDFELLRNLWNRPLDSISQMMVNSINGAKEGENITQPLVLDPKTGQPRTVTDEELEKIKKNQPIDQNTPYLKYLRVAKDAAGNNIITATDLTSEQLDKLQSGELPLQSPAAILAEREKLQKKPDDKVIEDTSVETKEEATVEDLKKLAADIAKEKDPKKREQLEEKFRLDLAGASEETQEAFIAQSQGAERDEVAKVLKHEKDARANGSGGGDGGGDGSGKGPGSGGSGTLDDAIYERLQQHYDKYVLFKTGIDNSVYVIGGHKYKTYNAEMLADTDDIAGKSKGDQKVMVNITEDENGKKTVNIVNKSMFIPYDENGNPMAVTDAGLIKQMQDESKKAHKESQPATRPKGPGG